MSSKEQRPPYIDDLTVREVYAESAQTLFGSPGTLRIELCVNRWGQHPPVKIRAVVPVARFSLSFDVARILRDQLTRCLEAVEKQAELAQAPAGSPMMQ